MSDNDKNTDSLLREIEKMAAYILNAKLEVAAIVPDTESEDNHIDHASIELTEVIKATEEATNSIMDEGDAIQAIADKIEQADIKAALSEHVGNLMAACAFQDITGQRIRKVLRMHDEIEARIGNLIKIFGGALPEGYVVKPITTGDGRPDEALMNGPQLTKDAPSQDDIDKLFANL